MADRARARVRKVAEGGHVAPPPPPPPPPPKRRRWPYALAVVLVWAIIIGAVFFSRFLSSLPDVETLLAKGPSQDITLLDASGKLIARRGLTQGALVDVSTLPRH